MNDKPLISSPLYTDWYKLSEWFYKFHFHPRVDVFYQSHNRTRSVRTADIIPKEALIEQLAALRELRFSETHIGVLRGTGFFAANPLGFSDHLRNFRFPEFHIRRVDGQWDVSTESVYAETFVMNCINGLLGRYRARAAGISEEKLFAEAERRLLAKIPMLKLLPQGSVLEFGTRRCFSPEWQRRELEILLNEVPEIVTATSNVQLALDFGIPWAGTHPHAGVLLEQLVALQQIYKSGEMFTEAGRQVIRESHMTFFKNWWKIFPYVSRVALTDTYGDDAFWQDWTYDLAYEGRGYRWDSGDWKAWTDQTLQVNALMGDLTNRYTGKDAVYSDGLDPAEMLKIAQYAKGKFRQILFGWGTDGSNDMGKYRTLGFTPISLVMKPVYGQLDSFVLYLIKISNNPAKMTNAPESFQKRILETFGYKLSEHTFVQPLS